MNLLSFYSKKQLYSTTRFHGVLLKAIFIQQAIQKCMICLGLDSHKSKIKSRIPQNFLCQLYKIYIQNVGLR